MEISWIIPPMEMTYIQYTYTHTVYTTGPSTCEHEYKVPYQVIYLLFNYTCVCTHGNNWNLLIVHNDKDFLSSLSRCLYFNIPGIRVLT